MKTKIRTLWKSIIMGMIPVVLITIVFSVSFQSCQKDEFISKEDLTLKGAEIPGLTLTYDDEYYTGEDINIVFSSTCGRIMIERGYINGDPIMEDGIIVAYEKIYTDLTCDTQGLLWEYIGKNEFLPCTGGTITEKWDEIGTYVYRAKLSQKTIKNSGCPDCLTFKGNKFECFTVTVSEWPEW